MPKPADDQPSLETRAVHGPDQSPGPLSTPVVFASTYAFPSLAAMNQEQARGAESAYYSRVGNPTVAACERRLADLEGAERALLFASGMASLTALFMSVLGPGDRVVTLRECYGGTRDLLELGERHCGWQVTWVGAEEPRSWEAALSAGARLFHVESPTNPTLRVVDLRRCAELAHAHGALLTVDGTFASPVLQRPIALGADAVMHSATKYLSGHSDVLAGSLAGPAALIDSVHEVRRITGGVLDPLSAWHLERGLKTLPLRVEAACRTAGDLAARLEGHAAVERVHYPGLPSHPQHELARRQMRAFGAMMSVVVKGGGEAARATAESLRLFRHGPSLGGVESLVSLPAFTSHVHMSPAERERSGIGDGLVRLSVGLEGAADLWADLERALTHAAAART
jgi:cystathionine beta-lyase/cystathionine gamma-synthase